MTGQTEAAAIGHGLESWTDAAAGTVTDSRRNRLAYRTFLRASDPDAVLDTVRASFAAWLAEKNLKVDEPTGIQRADIAEVSVDGQTRIRCRLTESHAATGAWRSELVASSEGWIHLAVTNSDGRRVNVPRIARALMRELELRDASMHLEDDVRLWDVGEVDQLIDLLMDPDRHGLVFVAGTGADFPLYEGFRDRLPSWMREVYGLAQCILLTPQATWELGERIGMHAVAPWTIRTFLPDVRVGSIADSRRHRYLSIGTLAQEPDGRVRQRLADIARMHAAQRAIPDEVSKARRLLDRAATEAVIDRLRPVTRLESRPERDVSTRVSPPEPVARPRKEVSTPAAAATAELDVDAVRALLGVDLLTHEAITNALLGAPPQVVPSNQADLDEALEMMEGQLLRIEALEEQLQSARALLEDDLIEQAELGADNEVIRGRVSDLEAEVKWLRGKLGEAGSHADAFAAAPTGETEAVPETCVELISSLSNDPVLMFTGDLGAVEEVDESDNFGMAVREAARACLALKEYARAYADGVALSGVDHFLRHTPSGYQGSSPGKHAQGETGVTKTQFGSERVFLVPEEVKSSGRLLMTAHFKLARIGMFSPRMYYYDDIPRSGRVYIGYLGRHLTNTQSN